jgi:hypothetical protein
MPYVTAEARVRLDNAIRLLSYDIATMGELNYVVTRLALRLLARLGVRYENIAGIVGTLHLVVLEMQRRFIGVYEDKKIAENGDVPEYRQ